MRETAAYVVREMLDKYGLNREDPTNFCLVQVTTQASEGGGGGGGNEPPHEYILEDDECPLSIQMNHTPGSGKLTFLFHCISLSSRRRRLQRQQQQLNHLIPTPFFFLLNLIRPNILPSLSIRIYYLFLVNLLHRFLSPHLSEHYTVLPVRAAAAVTFSSCCCHRPSPLPPGSVVALSNKKRRHGLCEEEKEEDKGMVGLGGDEMFFMLLFNISLVGLSVAGLGCNGWWEGQREGGRLDCRRVAILCDGNNMSRERERLTVPPIVRVGDVEWSCMCESLLLPWLLVALVVALL